MHVNAAVKTRQRTTQRLLGQLALADHPARRGHQLPQHLELARGQFKPVAVQAQAARLAVQRQGAHGGDVLGALAAPHQGPQAGLDLGQVKGLAQVVVGPGIQAGNAFLGAVAGRQHQHRHLVPAGAGGPQQGQAAAHALAHRPHGQIQIEQHRIKQLDAPEVVGLAQCGGLIHPVARLAQAAHHHVPEHGVVFNHQNSHACHS